MSAVDGEGEKEELTDDFSTDGSGHSSGVKPLSFA